MRKIWLNQWYRGHWIFKLLWPLSIIYRLIIAARILCFRCGLRKSTKFNIPIIIVGNLTVGGSGKTPIVIAVADFLTKQGYTVGIVSRGYCGKGPFPYYVNPTSDPEIVGDEPVLIARRTLLPCVVAPKRVMAVNYLLAKAPDCNVILCDDGLQHYQLARDIEIVVMDRTSQINTDCLPAGPFREPLSRLNKVNFILAHGIAKSGEFLVKFSPDKLYQLLDPSTTTSINSLKNQLIHAVAGIGNPSRYFTLLRELGLTIIEHSFPDHYQFSENDLRFSDTNLIIMTEKDAVKCYSFANERYWCLPITVELPTAFTNLLLERLHTYKLTSRQV